SSAGAPADGGFALALPGLSQPEGAIDRPAWVSGLAGARIETHAEGSRLILETAPAVRFNAFALTPDEDGGHRVVIDMTGLATDAAAAPAAAPSASADDLPLANASRALAAGDATGACRIVQASFPPGSWNLDAMFIEAQCRTDTGDIDGARSVYERMLAFDPSLERVETELAALPEPVAALAAPIPSPEGTQADGAPSALALATSRSSAERARAAARDWFLGASVESVFETGLELGAGDAETAALGGSPFSPLTGSASAGFGIASGLEGGARRPLGDGLTAIATGRLDTVKFFEGGDFDRTEIGGSAGLLYEGARYTASLLPYLRHERKGGEAFRTQYGLAAAVSRPVGQRFLADLALVLGQESHEEDSARDAFVASLVPGLEIGWGGSGALGAQYLVQSRSADGDDWSGWRHGPILSVARRLGANFEARARTRYLFADYEAGESEGDLAAADLGLFWHPALGNHEPFTVGLSYGWLEQDAEGGRGAGRHSARFGLAADW
ncbi:MAG: hypothetical protein HXY25_03840, partial [Alphaproteobacteria bacterium]|nr:hypothetical protein [Alphaproteobacteria bacterium]